MSARIKKYEVGSRFVNLNGTAVQVVEKLGVRRKIQVEGLEYTKIVMANQLQTGSYKTPYCKTVYGVGYFGEGEFKCRLEDGTLFEAYVVWANMLKRCYTDYAGDKKQHHCYENTQVCDYWHNYQNFASWYVDAVKLFRENDIVPKMDKDLLSDKSRGELYSPETCCILPNIINSALVEKRITNKVSHGVIERRRGKFVVHAMHKYTHYCKQFSDLDSAIDWYNETKLKSLIELANDYKHVLDTKVYDLLINWKWRGK